MADDTELEPELAWLDPTVMDSDQRPGELSQFTCPDCTGPHYEIQENALVRFRCRVGHAHTAGSVLEEKIDELEQALYAALNTLEESAQMSERLAAHSREHQHGYTVARFESRAQKARRQVSLIRRVLTGD